MELTNNNIQSRLEEISENNIKHRILKDVIAYSDDPQNRKTYLIDTIGSGCKSINDIDKFYDKYEAEIWSLLNKEKKRYEGSVFPLVGELIDNKDATNLQEFIGVLKREVSLYAYEVMASYLLGEDFDIDY